MPAVRAAICVAVRWRLEQKTRHCRVAGRGQWMRRQSAPLQRQHCAAAAYLPVFGALALSADLALFAGWAFVAGLALAACLRLFAVLKTFVSFTPSASSPCGNWTMMEMRRLDGLRGSPGSRSC